MFEEEQKKDKMKRDYENKDGGQEPCESELSTTITVMGEMYRQSWMMEEGEECLQR